MKSGDDLVFNDAFVEGLLDNPEKPKNAVVDFNYSPERGRIARFESLIRCRMISELYLVGQKISDLSFMENLINLVRVDLAWNEVESIVPLTKLPKLEYANLNHNAIEVIPKSISALSNLKILHLGFNKVSERSMLQHLKLNLNLWSLDLEGSTISCDPDSLLFCVYLLPQLGMLNRTIIDLDTRKKALDRFDRRTVEELTEANERLMDECNSLKHVATELRMQLKDESLDDKSAAKVIKQLREENARLVKYGESQEQKIAHLKEKSREMKRSYEELREKMINAESTRQYEPVSLQLRLQEMEIKCEDIRKQLEDKINENEQLSTQLEASRIDASEAKKKASSKVNKMKSQWGETKQELASARQEIETLKDELQRETNANAEEKMSLMSKIENISRKNQTLIEENAEMKRQCDDISQQASGLKYQDKSESHTIKEHFADAPEELTRLKEEVLKARAAAEKERHSKEDLIRQLKGEVADLKVANETNKKVIDGYQAKFETQEETITELRSRQQEMVNTITKLRRKLARSKQREEEQSITIQAMNEMQTSTQVSGLSSESQIQIHSQDEKVSGIRSRLKEMQRLSREQGKTIESMRDRINELEAENRELQNKQATEEQESLAETVEMQKQKINQLMVERARLIETVGQEIKARDAVIANLKKSGGKSQGDSHISDVTQLDALEMERKLRELEQELSASKEKSEKLAKRVLERNVAVEKMKQKVSEVQGENESLLNELASKEAEISEIEMRHESRVSSIMKENSGQDRYVEELKRVASEIKDKDMMLAEQKRLYEDQKARLGQEILSLEATVQKCQEQEKQTSYFVKAITDELNAQRKAYSLKSSVPSSKIDIERCMLLCSQTFREVGIKMEALEEEVAAAKRLCKKQEEESKWDKMSLVDEDKRKEDIITSLNAKLSSATSELNMVRQQAREAVPKTQYDLLQTKYEAVLSENEKYESTVKKMAAQIGQYKTSRKDEIRQMQETSIQAESELREKLATCEELLQRKKESHQQAKAKLTADNNKLKIKISELEEQLRSAGKENRTLKGKESQFNEFREDMSTTIQKLERQHEETESKLKSRVKECENEKLQLQLRLQEKQENVKDLQEENTKLTDTIEEIEIKMKQKEKDVFDLEKTIDRLKEQLSMAERVHATEKTKDKQREESLMNQLSELRRQADELRLSMSAEKNDMSKTLRVTEQKEKKLQKKLAKLAQYTHELQGTLEETTKKNDELVSILEQNNLKMQENNEKTARMEEFAKTTDHLFKTLTKKYNDLQTEHKNLLVAASNHNTLVAELQNQLNRKDDDIEDLRSDLNDLQAECDKHGEQTRNQTVKIAELNEKLLRAQTELERRDDLQMEATKENHDLRQQLADAQSEIEALSGKVKGVLSTMVDSSLLDNEVAKRKDLQKQVDTLASEVESKKEALKTAIAQNRKAQDQALAESAKLKSQIQDLTEQIEEMHTKYDGLEKDGESKSQRYESKIVELGNLVDGLRLQLSQQSDEKVLMQKEATESSERFTEMLRNAQNELSAKTEECAEKQRKINEMSTRIQKQESVIQDQNEKLRTAIDDYEAVKTQRDQESDDRTRQISQLRKQLRDMEEKNQQLERKVDSVQSELVEEIHKSSQKVPKEQYDTLGDKYESLKKLMKFEASKAQNAMTQKQQLIDEKAAEFNQRESDLNERIQSLVNEVNDKKELVKRLQRQIQADNNKIAQLEETEHKCAELDGVIANLQQELQRAKGSYQDAKRLQEKEMAKSQEQTGIIRQIKQILDTLRDSLRHPEDRAKQEFLNDIVGRINELARVLNIAEIPEVTFREYRARITRSLVSVTPESETLLARHKRIIETIKNALLAFPIGNPKFDIESHDQLEAQLQLLGSLIALVKRLFDEREKHIEELASMVESQHRAVMRISEQPVNPTIVADSYTSFQRTQSILRSDRTMRSTMATANSPQKPTYGGNL